MTKSELVEYLARQWKENGFSAVRRAEMQEAVGRIFDLLAAALAMGERIELRGFGSFSLHEIPARQGRNPRTGESVAVPSKKAVHFRPGREMRAQVDHG